MNKKIVIFILLILCITGCGKKEEKLSPKEEKINEILENSVNEGDSNNSLQILVENGIDLASLKPKNTSNTLTYQEALNVSELGVLFYIDKNEISNRKNTFVKIIDYFKIISSDNKVYDSSNLEFDYINKINKETEEVQLSYNYNDKKINIIIEYAERECIFNGSKDKCETYGVIFK